MNDTVKSGATAPGDLDVITDFQSHGVYISNLHTLPILLLNVYSFNL